MSETEKNLFQAEGSWLHSSTRGNSFDAEAAAAIIGDFFKVTTVFSSLD
jgi:hypothetical protein